MCFLLVACDSPLVCIPTMFVGVVSLVFPSLATVGPVVYGFVLMAMANNGVAALVVWALTFFVWWHVPTAIYNEIKGSDPFLTGLVAVMGASCLGPIGIILGPLLLVVPVQLLWLMLATEGPEGSPGGRSTPSIKR
eukprot:SRR837773.13899.p2 GENE.SRR837773.13899~~SRR837773.13899.p2  ORF type:complete len:136 (-),score=27.79 SRR837773.13899:98-505(-)